MNVTCKSYLLQRFKILILNTEEVKRKVNFIFIRPRLKFYHVIYKIV